MGFAKISVMDEEDPKNGLGMERLPPPSNGDEGLARGEGVDGKSVFLGDGGRAKRAWITNWAYISWTVVKTQI